MTWSRRDFLKGVAAAVSAPAATAQTKATRAAKRGAEKQAAVPRKKIAALVSVYHIRSHADNIVTRFLQGYYLGSQRFPSPADIVSLYRDQAPSYDISRRLSETYGFRIFSTPAEALMLGTSRLAVDGVLLIFEQGDYPFNEKGQQLYPRYEFFKQVVDVFEASGRVVPVFLDKHFSYDWEKAQWMYNTARRLKIPLMAGSSLPVTFRRPELDIPLETKFEEALAVGFGPPDAYGFHALETLQCFAERRTGGESGVAAVRSVEGPQVWELGERGVWSRSLLQAALERSETRLPGAIEARARNPFAFLVEYRDGTRGAALLLNGLVRDFTFAARVKPPGGGRGSIVYSTECYIPWENSNNFSALTRSIANHFRNSRPDYPVERTLLTTGLTAFGIDSRFRGGARMETPQLAEIRYRAPAESVFVRGAGG